MVKKTATQRLAPARASTMPRLNWHGEGGAASLLATDVNRARRSAPRCAPVGEVKRIGGRRQRLESHWRSLKLRQALANLRKLGGLVLPRRPRRGAWPRSSPKPRRYGACCKTPPPVPPACWQHSSTNAAK